MSRRSVTARTTLAVLVALLVALMANSPTAGAQTTGSVELVAQSAWVDDGGIYNIQVRIAGAPTESAIILRIYEPWTQRDDFLRGTIPEDAQLLLEHSPVVLSDAQETSNEVLNLEVLLDGPNTRLEEPEPPTTNPEATGTADLTDVIEQQPLPFEVLTTDGGSAVYPVEVALVDSAGETTDSFVTSLIELPRRDLRPPLAVATVLEAVVDVDPTPNTAAELDDETLTNVGVLATIIAQHPDANVALSISPETLALLANDDGDVANEIVEQLRSNLSASQLFPNPFVDIEEQAWFDAELTNEVIELYAAGSDNTIESIGIEPQTSVMLLDETLTSEGVDHLGELGVQGAIVRPDQLRALDRNVFTQALTTSFLLDSDDPSVQEIPALVADGDLSTHFTNEGGSVLNANRLLADLVILSLQDSTGRQSAVVNPPADWQPDDTFLNVYLSGIERIPSLRGASPEQALAETAITPSLGIGTISGPLVRSLNPPAPATSLRSYRTEYSQARNAIESWTTVIGSDTSSRRRLDELLFSSTDHRQSEQQQNDFIEAVYSLIDLEKDSAILAPEAETITLTGRESLVPIVIENRLDTRATVLMILSSDELDFAEGSEIVQSLEPGPNRIEIPIIARASGDSPINIQILSPDGLILLGSAEVLVRTFAFSGVGIAIGGVAIIVLFFWWLRDVRGSREDENEDSDTHTNEADEMIGV